MPRSQEAAIQHITASSEDAGKRLDLFLATQIPTSAAYGFGGFIRKEGSRRRQTGEGLSKASRHGTDRNHRRSPATRPTRHRRRNSPRHRLRRRRSHRHQQAAGMMAHAGAGATEDARNRGTLVNALLHRFQSLSEVGGDLRPGIVHRLDRQTSGLMIVAKNDVAHRKLATRFLTSCSQDLSRARSRMDERTQRNHLRAD